MNRFKMIFLFCCIVCSFNINAQGLDTEDARMWAGIGFKYKIDSKWTASLGNIVRIKDDIGTYRDYFIEPRMAYQINSKLNARASYRWTVIPDDGEDWQWIFLDFNAKQKLGDSPITLTSRTRYHHGFDINERVDPDFLREYLAVRHKVGAFNSFVAIGCFFRLNQINEIQVMRYEIGTSWKISPSWSVNAAYRRQDNVFDMPFRFNGRFNVAVVGLTYTIVKKKAE